MFEEVIKHYPDFPKEGIDFIDVLPFLQDKKVFAAAVKEIDRCCTTANVATVEARGFLFAAPLLCCSGHVDTIVPIRKKGKLPHDEGDLQKVCIEKEYGSDEVFYRRSDLAACSVKGDTIELTISRSGKEETVKLVLDEADEEEASTEEAETTEAETETETSEKHGKNFGGFPFN